MFIKKKCIGADVRTLTYLYNIAYTVTDKKSTAVS